MNTQQQLAYLATRLTQAVNLTMPCRSCGHEGPHESNDLKGQDHEVLCTECGDQWNPDGYQYI